MSPIIGFAILAGLAGLLGIAVGAVFARPRPKFIIGAAAQAGVFAWLAISSHHAAKQCEATLDARRDYPLVTAPDGDHTVRIEELHGIHGLHVEACYISGSKSPTDDTMKTCDWRVDGKPIETGVVVADFESDDWGRGRFKRLDVTYRVTEKSKPHLDGLVLRASPPRMVLKGAYVFRDVNRMLATILGIGTLAGIAGFASQLIRARRKRNAQARH